MYDRNPMNSPGSRWYSIALKLTLINACVFVFLLMLVELIFGNWIRPLTVNDLKRFSIPIDVQFSYSTNGLYGPAGAPAIRYTRDKWGLRGNYTTLADIDVLTVGGSTTDQKFLDDGATWQAVAERHLAAAGRPLIFANAGVDGQSTTGHIFNFENWFPLLPQLRPRFVVFYLGVNDVMRHATRGEFDAALDASSWRVKSATWQLVRTVRGALNARAVQVVHGRKPDFVESDFSSQGLLAAELRESLAQEIAATFIANVDRLRQRTEALGSHPIFMTQSTFAWYAGRGAPRGLMKADPVTILGHSVSFADVSYLHQRLNAELLAYCAFRHLRCLDAATEVHMDPGDYYDFVHTTPAGARKLGEYLAGRMADLHTAIH